MQVHPDFQNTSGLNPMRVRFCFTACGTKGAGGYYVNRNVEPGADLMVDAAKAAKIVAKRAGADVVTLTRITAPDR
jgi:hypothetical protein